MPRLLIPTGFTVQESYADGPTLPLANAAGHRLSVHPIESSCSSIIRVVHELPERFHQKQNGSVQYEVGRHDIKLQHPDNSSSTFEVGDVKIEIDYRAGPRLSWSRQGEVLPFLTDSETRAYTFDAATGAVFHYVERESHLPLSENEHTSGPHFVHPDRSEFVYGLGESRGSLEKSGKRFTMEGRDALSYDWEHGDPLYKVNPFYVVHNRKSKQQWYGMFYNNLNDSSFDMGAEIDVLWGCFRSYRANTGPLDYYVILGDGTLPSILTGYASLVSPSSALPHPISASPTLPPLSQFGYLSSSLALAAEPKAQEAIIAFLKRSRAEGFPVDGLYLSSGWCQEDRTQNRHYFEWNHKRYPSPSEFGRTVEQELQVQVIVNVKPWLLDDHQMLHSAEEARAFVRAPQDALGDPARASPNGSLKSWVWGSGFGSHVLGSYFDYSSRAGSEWWKTAITEHILKNNLTGIWIDNNEMAGMIDDEGVFAGEVPMFDASTGSAPSNVESRMGWGGEATRIGSVGKAVQTAGMARATSEAVLLARPNDRPVIVSRSFTPGMQAFAHASWSGDNSTTWKALKFGTKMTLSAGISFGPGLYGHDIGGFAGEHHPSPELLVRWCQNGAWHSRFTVHSWKATSTTLFMYNDVPGIPDILRNVLAFRYRLAPTFYSLYVHDYHRRGWPLLKPLLWHHSDDPTTLKMDEAFLFGSHFLVACVVEKGATNRSVYLPGIANDGERDLWWAELDTGVWHSARAGRWIEMDAPLSRTPVLARGGAILVLGGACHSTIHDGAGSRTVLVFSAPSSATSGLSGSFTLIEDDGKSNAHLDEGRFTEIELSFKVVGETVEVGWKLVHGDYPLPYTYIAWELPKGDMRQLVLGAGMEAADSEGDEAFCMKAPSFV